MGFDLLERRALLVVPPITTQPFNYLFSGLTATLILDNQVVTVVVDQTASGTRFAVQGVADFNNTPFTYESFALAPGGALSIIGGLNTSVVVDDQAGLAGDNYRLTSNEFDIDRPSGSVAPNSRLIFSTIPNLTFDAGTGASSFQISGTPPNSATTVNGSSGDDVFDVGLGDVGDLSNLTINGGGGFDAINYSDSDSLTSGGLTLSTTQLTRPSNATGPGDPNLNLHYEAISSLNIATGSGSDTINVEGTAPNTATTIEAGNGFKQFTVGQNGDVSQVRNLSLIGGPGPNSLVFDNSAYPGLEALQVDASTINVGVLSGISGLPDLAVSYLNMATLVVNEGPGPNLIFVNGTAPETTTTINGGGGDDAFNVDINPFSAVHDLLLDGGSGNNVLNYDDTTFGIGRSPALQLLPDAIIPGTSIDPGEGATRVGYSGMTSVVLGLGNGINLVEIRGTAPNASTSVFGGVGTTFDVGLGSVGLVGNLSIEGGGGPSVLNFDDGADTQGSSLDVSASRINAPPGLQGAGFPNLAVEFQRISTLNVITGPGPDLISVPSTAPGTTVNIQAGAGRNIIQVGNTFNGTTSVGPLSVSSNSGNNLVQAIVPVGTVKTIKASSNDVRGRDLVQIRTKVPAPHPVLAPKTPAKARTKGRSHP